MSEAQIQAIKDVIKMTARLNLDYLMESKQIKDKELKDAVSLEEVLKREGLTLDDLQDKD